MKKTTHAEDARLDFQTFFDAEDFNEHRIACHHRSALQNNSESENTRVLDNLLTMLKWMFLYLPGAATIHFVMMGFGLARFYDDLLFQILPVAFVAFGFATFMIMFGIGKLRDLKYLKVVLGVLLTSAFFAVLFSFLAGFVAGDFFGSFARATLPLTMLVGYLIKRRIDNEIEDL